jgi:hypothetical protein
VTIDGQERSKVLLLIARSPGHPARTAGSAIGVSVSSQAESSVFVSLQSGPLEPGAGFHVASGALAGRDLAMFALPLRVELRADMRLHVLVSPLPPRADDVVERILPLGIQVVSLAADPRARVAVVRLANPSRYRAADADRAALQARLAPHLDADSLPQALRDAGLLAGGSVPESVEGILAIITGIESAQVRRLITEWLGRPPADLAALFDGGVTSTPTGAATGDATGTSTPVRLVGSTV